MAENELLTAVSVPREGVNTGSAYAKLFNPASRYAIVGAAVQLTVTDGKCTAAGVGIGGLTPHAVQASHVEAALVGNELNEETITAAANAVAQDLGEDILGDIHAGADYRRQMAPVMIKRAIQKAAERAT